MPLSTLVQIVAAALGVIGSLFFTIGVVQQSASAMAKLAQTYFDSNQAAVRALAAQRADYIFGGVLIVAAFGAQMGSFLPSKSSTVAIGARETVGLAILAAIILFLLLHRASTWLAGRYEREIQQAIAKDHAEAAAAEAQRRAGGK
jgi:hypothetical protein